MYEKYLLRKIVPFGQSLVTVLLQENTYRILSIIGAPLNRGAFYSFGDPIL